MRKKYCVLCLLLFIQIQFIFSQDDKNWDNPENNGGWGDTLTRGAIATGETMLSNMALMLLNTTVGQPWALPTTESIKGSFTRPWSWEVMDRFIVNQLGHQVHGSNYFVSGRVNGFNFYESVFFNVLGSYTWETFCESQHASMNDFVTTITGSMASGEMLYRLHLEAYGAGIPLPVTFFISPIGGFHILVTGGKKTPYPGKNIYQLQAYFGGGYTKTLFSLIDDQQEIFSFAGPQGDIGLNVIYGNPFEQDTIIPYRHFELNITAGLNPGNYNNYRVISDGYLFSFSPIYSDMTAMSTGLSMHFDFVSQGSFDLDMYTSTISQYSNALDWTIKYQHLFSENNAVELKYHAGFTFLGTSQYYNPNSNKEASNNYGYGFNSKLFFNLENKKLGRLETDILAYVLWPYSETTYLSGTTLWLFANITYSHFILKNFSIGTTGSLSMEWGFFDNYPDTKKRIEAIKVFVAWNL